MTRHNRSDRDSRVSTSTSLNLGCDIDVSAEPKIMSVNPDTRFAGDQVIITQVVHMPPLFLILFEIQIATACQMKFQLQPRIPTKYSMTWAP